MLIEWYKVLFTDMAANVNNYISAANAAVSKNVQIRKALADSKVRYDDISKATVNQAARNRANAAENNARIARSTMDANTRVKGQEIAAETEKDIRGIYKNARMTGRLAGGAALLGIGAMQLNKEEEVDPTLGVLQDQIKKQQERIDASVADYERLSKIGEGLNTKIDSQGNPTNTDSSSSTSTSTSTSTSSNSNLKNGSAWSKLSDIIRFGEGTLGDKGYNTQFTGSQFTDTSRHPRQIKSSGNLSSDAAGAYQFLSTTWDGAKKALGLKDFSPASQEAAGRYLTQQRGVDPDKVIGSLDEFRGVMDKLAPEWASLPYSGKSPGGYGQGSSYYGQGGKTLEELWSRYQNSGL